MRGVISFNIMAAMKAVTQIGARTTQDFADALEQLADLEDRSMAQVIKRALLQYVSDKIRSLAREQHEYNSWADAIARYANGDNPFVEMSFAGHKTLVAVDDGPGERVKLMTADIQKIQAKVDAIKIDEVEELLRKYEAIKKRMMSA